METLERPLPFAAEVAALMDTYPWRKPIHSPANVRQEIGALYGIPGLDRSGENTVTSDLMHGNYRLTYEDVCKERQFRLVCCFFLATIPAALLSVLSLWILVSV